MPDLYADIANIPAETQSILANANVIRAGDPAMAVIRRRLFDSVETAVGAKLLEVGCGPGDVLEELMLAKSASEAVGVDPSPVMVEKANARHAGIEGLSFAVGDGRELSFADASFDLVLFHTTLVHVPRADAALAEAFRVLKPGGRLVIFEGDYTTTTAALGANDPLQGCIDHAVGQMVHDPYFCRSAHAQCAAAGFHIERVDAHPYLASGDAAYFLSLLNRGADFLASELLISSETADRLKEDAKARVEAGRFFGFISYVSLVATKS